MPSIKDLMYPLGRDDNAEGNFIRAIDFDCQQYQKRMYDAAIEQKIRSQQNMDSLMAESKCLYKNGRPVEEAFEAEHQIVARRNKILLLL